MKANSENYYKDYYDVEDIQNTTDIPIKTGGARSKNLFKTEQLIAE